jgi:inosose dehydratase
MRDVGLAATEVGPAGFLPSDPGKLVDTLADHDLHAVGGFVPVVLHQPGHDPVPDVDLVLDGFVAAHASTIVLSADSGLTGYDSRPTLDEQGWSTLFDNLDRLSAAAAARGITAVLHPHVGTMVEKPDEVQRVLEGSGISLCLDTGHLLIGGTDPAELTRQVPERIAHTHMKDVDNRFARRVQAGELTYTEAVREGMYRPLGSGDVDVAAIVSYLEGHGYDGWYVLEQDTILPTDPAGEGPVGDVRTSVEYLKGLFAKVGK